MRNNKNLLKAINLAGADLTTVDVYTETANSSRAPILSTPNTLLIFKMTKDGRYCYVTSNERTFLGYEYDKMSWKSILDACNHTVYCIDLWDKSNQKSASKMNARVGYNEDYYSDNIWNDSSGDTTKYRHPNSSNGDFDKSGYRKRTLTYWMNRLNSINDVSQFNIGTLMKLLARYYHQIKSAGSRIKSYITSTDPMELSSADASQLLREYKHLLNTYDNIAELVDKLIHDCETGVTNNSTVDQLNKVIRRITQDINTQLSEISKILNRI